MARKKKTEKKEATLTREKLVKLARQVGVPHPEMLKSKEDIKSAMENVQALPEVQVPSPVVEPENAVADDSPVYQ